MKKFISVIFISLILAALLIPSAFAAGLPSWYPENIYTFEDFYGTNLARVKDDANILSDSEEASLTRMINAVIEKHGYDLVIYTDTTNYGIGPYDESCAIDFFRFNGYGLGPNRSGMIIYINMDSNDRYFSVVGTGDVETRAYNYNEAIREQMLPEMKTGDYYGALQLGVELVDQLYASGRIAKKRTIGDYAGSIFAAVIVGLIAGLSNMSSKVKNMKKVAFAKYANDYIVKNSFNLRHVNEMFLYKNVTRTYIEPSSRSGGGSSHSGMHSSGGGGGSFSGGSSRF